jgi:hypothetical protein
MQLQLPLFMILCWLAVGTVHAPAALRAGSICAAPEVQRVHSKVHSAAARRGATHAPCILARGVDARSNCTFDFWHVPGTRTRCDGGTRLCLSLF